MWGHIKKHGKRKPHTLTLLRSTKREENRIKLETMLSWKLRKLKPQKLRNAWTVIEDAPYLVKSCCNHRCPWWLCLLIAVKFIIKLCFHLPFQLCEAFMTPFFLLFFKSNLKWILKTFNCCNIKISWVVVQLLKRGTQQPGQTDQEYWLNF